MMRGLNPDEVKLKMVTAYTATTSEVLQDATSD